jgi:hypothetical protein
MGNILANGSCAGVGVCHGRFQNRVCALLLGTLLAFGLTGCHHKSSANTQLLDRSGMDFASVQQIRGLNVTTAEIAEILKMRDAGFSDPSCVQAVQIAHNQNQPFRADDIIGMKQAGMTEQMIFQLAAMPDFGMNAGELEAMHLAGLSDAIVMEVARRRAEGKPVLSGAALADLKNAGVRSATLLELVRHGVPDSEGKALLASRRHGAKDAQLLHHFTGS